MDNSFEKLTTKPFLKWAGGKKQLLDSITAKYPTGLGTEINRYCEPFVGGGAVLFDVLATFSLKEILINDINVELINAYETVRDDNDALIRQLYLIQQEYISKEANQRKEYYYSKRELFNNLKTSGNKSKNIEKAALFIFLNKTCFNGLFRVNSKGLFNVPMGDSKNPLICDADNLKSVSVSLKKVSMKCGDYAECLSFINDKTFVYIDPPYRPLTQTASFNSYNENQFNDDEQIRLGKFVNRICTLGAKVLVSNSDPKNTDKNDLFFDNIYSEYNIERISARRMINSNGSNRGSISELLISNICNTKERETLLA